MLTDSVGVLADCLPKRRLRFVKPSLAGRTRSFFTGDTGYCSESANTVKAKGFKSKPTDTVFLGDFHRIVIVGLSVTSLPVIRMIPTEVRNYRND